MQGTAEVQGAAFSGDGGEAAIAAQTAADLARAVAIVAKAAFDEASEQPHAIRVVPGDALVMLAGTPDALPVLEAGAGGGARDVNFTKGGKGLR